MVGNGADRERALACRRRVHVESRRLHLNAENAHLVPALIEARVCVIEDIGGEKVTNLIAHADRLCLLNRAGEKLIACDGSVVAVEVVLILICRVGAGALTDDDVAELYVVCKTAGRADTDDILYTEEVVELIGIDTDRGHTHTARHYRDGNALVSAGVTLNSAHVVNESGILEEGLGYEFRTERISGHKNCLCKIGRCCLNVRGVLTRHVFLLNKQNCFLHFLRSLRYGLFRDG